MSDVKFEMRVSKLQSNRSHYTIAMFAELAYSLKFKPTPSVSDNYRHAIRQECTYPRCQVARATKLLSVEPNDCGSSLWDLTSCHYSGAQKYQVVFSFVRNLCTLALSFFFTYYGILSKCIIALRGC